jgi:hypothetical protein
VFCTFHRFLESIAIPISESSTNSREMIYMIWIFKEFINSFFIHWFCWRFHFPQSFSLSQLPKLIYRFTNWRFPWSPSSPATHE